MKKRKNDSPEFKAKVVLEALREEMTLAELSKKYGVHPNMISTWKRTAIANMASGFERSKPDEARASEAEIDSEPRYAIGSSGVGERIPRLANSSWSGIF